MRGCAFDDEGGCWNCDPTPPPSSSAAGQGPQGAGRRDQGARGAGPRGRRRARGRAGAAAAGGRGLGGRPSGDDHVWWAARPRPRRPWAARARAAAPRPWGACAALYSASVDSPFFAAPRRESTRPLPPLLDAPAAGHLRRRQRRRRRGGVDGGAQAAGLRGLCWGPPHADLRNSLLVRPALEPPACPRRWWRAPWTGGARTRRPSQTPPRLQAGAGAAAVPPRPHPGVGRCGRARSGDRLGAAPARAHPADAAGAFHDGGRGMLMPCRSPPPPSLLPAPRGARSPPLPRHAHCHRRGRRPALLGPPSASREHLRCEFTVEPAARPRRCSSGAPRSGPSRRASAFTTAAGARGSSRRPLLTRTLQQQRRPWRPARHGGKAAAAPLRPAPLKRRRRTGAGAAAPAPLPFYCATRLVVPPASPPPSRSPFTPRPPLRRPRPRRRGTTRPRSAPPRSRAAAAALPGTPMSLLTSDPVYPRRCVAGRRGAQGYRASLAHAHACTHAHARAGTATEPLARSPSCPAAPVHGTVTRLSAPQLRAARPSPTPWPATRPSSWGPPRSRSPEPRATAAARPRPAAAASRSRPPPPREPSPTQQQQRRRCRTSTRARGRRDLRADRTTHSDVRPAAAAL